MDKWIIDNSIVENHFLWKRCPSTLHDISEKDYPRKEYFRDSPMIEALDLDAYEKQLKKAEPNCTGDAVIGVAKTDVRGRLTDSSLLIVELRLNYKRGDNVSLQKLTKKIESSKDLINCEKVQINDKYCFIFLNKRICAQAQNIMYREAIAANKRGQYLMFTLLEFKSKLKEMSNVLPNNIHSQKDIFDSLRVSISNEELNITKLEENYNYWRRMIQKYQCQYNIEEVDHIRRVVQNSLDTIKQELHNGTVKSKCSVTDDVILIELMTEYLN